MEYSEYLDKLMLKANEKWFKFYVKIPLITAILVGIFFFVWGIVDATNFQEVIIVNRGGKTMKITLYGFLKIESRIGSELVWWGIGVFASLASYFVLKAIVSPKILSVLYLRKIKQDLDKIVFTKDVKLSLQEIDFSEWKCANCGTINRDTLSHCKSCFTPKP